MVAAVVLEEEDRTLVRVRAITRFVVLEPDTQTWNWSLGEAGRLLSELSAAYRGLGYDVQSCRIVTNPFGEFLNCSSAETALAGLGVLKGCLSELDDGASRVRNFNFTANFNCGPGIPYFPAAYNLRENGESFAVGLEHGGLILRELRAEDLGAVAAPERSAALRRAFGRVRDAVEAHVAPLVEAAEAAAAARQVAFAGVDSVAGALPRRVHLRPLRGAGRARVGAAGTVEAAALLARMFKSPRGAPLVGFSGLMLSCLEDEGLAAAAGRGQLDIYTLLQCSCVCGIGLDCVPVPGDCPRATRAPPQHGRARVPPRQAPHGAPLPLPGARRRRHRGLRERGPRRLRRLRRARPPRSDAC
ncbi:phosphatase [Aureococcus anophagefferens]|nr:phosphatase [Aureococcus anophagefferens]